MGGSPAEPLTTTRHAPSCSLAHPATIPRRAGSWRRACTVTSPKTAASPVPDSKGLPTSHTSQLDAEQNGDPCSDRPRSAPPPCRDLTQSQYNACPSTRDRRVRQFQQSPNRTDVSASHVASPGLKRLAGRNVV